MKMKFNYIIIIESGSLGNQIFQYLAIKKIYPKHKIILIGFSSLKNTFQEIDAIFITIEKKVLFKTIFKLFNLLSNLKLINSVSEKCNKVSELINTFGIISKVTICLGGYFQSEKYIEIDHIKDLKIKDDIIKSALTIINKISIKDNFELVFVHIRRGDYLSWPSLEFPAVLPTAWYISAINYIEEKIKNPYYIFCSNDHEYVTDHFGHMSNMYVSNGDEKLDFALMSMCRHGVLSASTFSWWAGRLSYIKTPDSSYFYAPLYWIGHCRMEWAPPESEASWLTYYPSGYKRAT